MNAPARTRVFKSGRSLAVRLARAFGLAPGTELGIVQDLHLRPVRRRIDLNGTAGSMPWLRPLPRQDFNDPRRGWPLLDSGAAA